MLLQFDGAVASRPFQAYCDRVYSRVIWTLMFGRAGWEAIRPHLSSFKANTIKVCETTGFHGENVFHMHLDGKIGLLQANNQSQKKTIRLLFSIVPGAFVMDTVGGVNPDKARGDGTAAAGSGSALLAHGCTVYPVWQLQAGFRNNAEFHRYMVGRYHECGLSTGLPRPLYVIPEPLVYRATSGEVLVHKSHADAQAPQPIHAEANPCRECCLAPHAPLPSSWLPEVAPWCHGACMSMLTSTFVDLGVYTADRYLFVFDFANIITRTEDRWGKVGPRSAEIPEAAILDQIGALTDSSAPAFRQRLADVARVAQELLGVEADKYPDGRAAVEGVLAAVNELAAKH